MIMISNLVYAAWTGGIFGRGWIIAKQDVVIVWQRPVAIIRKGIAGLTNNMRVPYVVWLRIQVSPRLKAEGFWNEADTPYRKSLLQRLFRGASSRSAEYENAVRFGTSVLEDAAMRLDRTGYQGSTHRLSCSDYSLDSVCNSLRKRSAKTEQQTVLRRNWLSMHPAMNDSSCSGHSYRSWIQWSEWSLCRCRNSAVSWLPNVRDVVLPKYPVRTDTFSLAL